jgi:hypothetical protein
MKDKSKILPRVIIVILIVSLITTLVLTSVYAKYVSKEDPAASTARPAAFELVLKPMWDDEGFNFAADGEPGNPIGHTEARKNYDFRVKTSGSEVSTSYLLEIKFSNKITKMIYAGRADKLSAGICCDYEVYQKQGSSYVKIATGSESGLGNSSTSSLTWSYSNTNLAPNVNPDGSSGTDAAGKDIYTDYRLVMIVYNNTTMPSNGNTDKYVLSSDGIEISVTSTQNDPGFKGQYAGVQ